MVRIVVPGSRKIKPFGVTELVADEIQPAFSGHRMGDQPYELV